jgi:[ribosomal protein S18]-alanine N-acetyltransferase
LHVRLAISADIPAMMELEQQIPAAAHWSRLQYENLFAAEPPSHSERLILVAEEFPHPGGSEQSDANRIFAFLVAHQIGAEWELENIVVAQNAQRNGVGTRLLKQFIGHAYAQDAHSIFLEVRESNQNACGFYRKAGFEECGIRKGYYTHPSESAILYRLSLS